MKAAYLSSLILLFAMLASPLAAQTYALLPAQITTPDQVSTPIGQLGLRDGIPSAETADKIYDYLDLTNGVESFLNGFSGVSMYAIRQGFWAPRRHRYSLRAAGAR
jgi:hypothetical protein